MLITLESPAETGRYLRSLRDRDRAAIGRSDAEADAVGRLIEAHTVVMAHGPGLDEPVEESLATWLSLLDHDAWRERVRAVRVDDAFLGAAELELLARVREDAGTRALVAVA